MRLLLLWTVALSLPTACSDRHMPAEIPFVATHTLTATITPSPTSTPTPTSMPTPTPTPTPTPLPGEILARAEYAYRIGDWDMAEVLYGQLLPLSSITQEEAQRALLGMGQTLLARGHHAEAIPLLENVLVSAPQLAEAHLYLADALLATQESISAALHYAALAQAYPLLTHPAREWQGDALYAAGEYAAARDAYTLALEAADTNAKKAFLGEKLGLTYAALGDETAALAAYDAILDRAQIAAYRARIMLQAAETALLFGDNVEGYRRLQNLIATYPTQASAHAALVKLVEAGQPVDDIVRGLVNYHAQSYDAAIRAFTRVINNNAAHSGEPHYYIGMSYLGAGNYIQALSAFETLLKGHRGDTYWGSGWIGKAQALAGLGRLEEALQAYRTLAAELPTHPRAAEALWKVAELLEGAGRFDEAAQAYLDMAETFPNDEGAPPARFRAGLLRYRDGRLSTAQAAWSDLIAWYPYSEQAQAAHFWLGKTYLQAGNLISATAAFDQAVALGPWSYYGLRAADLQKGREPFTATTTLEPCGSATEQAEAEQWLAGRLGLESTTGVATLPPALLDNVYLRRGTLLLRLGEFDAGRDDLETLREATAGDALTQYRLALYFRDIGLYRSSILAAATLWRLAGAPPFQEVPRFIGCLMYPTYYGELVEQEATARYLDPLLVYALLRQESLFEGYATSHAAAHGLMQVIPSTGAQIAQALGWPPDYATTDLYRPLVSVRFGVWYLARQRDALADNLFAGMAAYNGGPGNAARWWNAAGGDQDLFVELIGFAETRTYVERIREHYARYEWLYRRKG